MAQVAKPVGNNFFRSGMRNCGLRNGASRLAAFAKDEEIEGKYFFKTVNVYSLFATAVYFPVPF